MCMQVNEVGAGMVAVVAFGRRPLKAAFGKGSYWEPDPRRQACHLIIGSTSPLEAPSGHGVGAGTLFALWLATAVLVGGCGGVPVAGQRSPMASPVSEASAAAVPPISPVAFSCRLPVVWTEYPGPKEQAGFISLPSGTFTPDLTSGISTSATGGTQTVQGPVLNGEYQSPVLSAARTYDLAYRRWLPVANAQVLPDGSAYVYTRYGQQGGSGNEIHLVQVASGADTLIYNQGSYAALDYEPEGVYLTQLVPGKDGTSGLWLLDPTTETLKAFPAAGNGSWAAIAGGGAWSFIWDGPRFGWSKFARLDLSTGAVTVWLDVSSQAQPYDVGFKTVFPIGFDSSLRPLVEVYVVVSGANGGENVAAETWLLRAPAQSTRLSGLPLPPFAQPLGVTDSHGTWLSGTDGVYLYTGAGFLHVAHAPATTAAAASYTIVGVCA
jgi:hypothetical protein